MMIEARLTKNSSNAFSFLHQDHEMNENIAVLGFCLFFFELDSRLKNIYLTNTCVASPILP